MQYDEYSEESIYNYAKKLEGKTFAEAIKMGQESLHYNNGVVNEADAMYMDNITSKGSSGHILEKYYFGYDLNNSEEPDFQKVGIELKIAPLKIGSKGKLMSKERMVLTLINYNKVVKEDFIESHLLKKSNKILMIFYLYDKEKDKLNYRIMNVYKYNIPKEDLPIIKRDYQTIIGKIVDGKAHEISEADTLFLGASTKGVDKNSMREQPNSDILAAQRAFSFKSSYINFIYNNYVLDSSFQNERLIKKYNEIESHSFEEITVNRLKKYIGMSENEIVKKLGYTGNKTSKHLFSVLTYRMLGLAGNKAEEFEKANIVVKTIRLTNRNRIKESMSFKSFKFMDIYNQSWEESDLRTMFANTKFLLVIYKMNISNQYVLLGSQFWNMPVQDIEDEVRTVWENTKKVISEGIVTIEKDGKIYNNFSGSSRSRICHVRSHARNRMDTYPTPDGTEFTKQSFWLNNNYVLSILNPSFWRENY